MVFWNRLRFSAALGAASLLLASTWFFGAASAAGADIAGKTVTFIIYATPDTPFFVPVVNGAKDAAKLYGLNLNVEYSNSNAITQNNQIETAIARNVAGLALSLPSDSAFTKSVCDAQKAGIPVVAFNVTATSGPVLNCVEGFSGQDFVAAGKLIAEQLIKAGSVPQGAHVFCPVEDATAVYAVGRAKGADEALATIGAKCDVVATGFDLAKAQTTEEQYLLGHRNTNAILALGLVPLQVAPAAAKADGITVPIAGFDLSQQVSTDIQNSSILATVEQQPYMQGYYAVIELALQLKYGLIPPPDVNTGNLIVDSSNVSSISSLAGPVF